MKFRLFEDFSKSTPEWLKKFFTENTQPWASVLKHSLKSYFDFNKAKFKMIMLPTDINEKEKVLWHWIDKATAYSLDKPDSFMLFILLKTIKDSKECEMVFCPYVNEDAYSDEGNLRTILALYPEKVVAICYATDFRKDTDLVTQRRVSKDQHDISAFNGNERFTYDGTPYSKNRIVLDDRQFDASGYLQKPFDYYTKKLLKYQRSDIARTLEDLNNKIQDCANVIKDFITNEVDLVDLKSYDQAQSLLKKLNVASKRYNRAMSMLDLCENDEEIDELFKPKSEFDSLNKLIKDLVSATKQVRYTDFDW